MPGRGGSVALLAFVGLALGFARCSPDAPAGRPPPSPPVAASAAPRPKQKSPGSLHAYGLPADAESVRYFPRGGSIAAFTLRPEVCVRPDDFFSRYAKDFGIRPGLDAVAPDSIQSRPSAISLHQTFKGVAVSGHGYFFNLRSDGCIDRGTGHIVSPLYEEVRPKIDADSARRTACTSIGVPPNPSYQGTLRLMSDPNDGGLPGTFRLIWEFHPAKYGVLIDAGDGRIYRCITDLDDGPDCPATARPSAHPLAFGKLSFGGQPNVTIHLDGSLLGLLPRTEIAVTPGTHTILLARDGARKTRTVKVANHDSVPVSVYLE